MIGNPPRLDRRRFLQVSAASAACGVASYSNAAASDPHSLIDTHVYLGNWPLRQLPAESPAELVALLRRSGVTQGWTGSFDGLFHKDVQGVNSRLAKMCRDEGGGVLIPIGTVNPMLPDWQDDIRRCHEEFRMPGVRLHPTYHGYTLDDSCFARLLELAAARELFVQVVVQMAHERGRLLTPRVAHLDLAPLAKGTQQTRGVRLLLSNGIAAAANTIVAMSRHSNTYIDTAWAKDGQPLNSLIESAGDDRLVFGSCAPLMDFAASFNLIEQAKLNPKLAASLHGSNAKRLIGDE